MRKPDLEKCPIPKWDRHLESRPLFWRIISTFCNGYFSPFSARVMTEMILGSSMWISGGIPEVKSYQIVGVCLDHSTQEFLIYISIAIHQNDIVSVPTSFLFQVFLCQISQAFLWIWICLSLHISRWQFVLNHSSMISPRTVIDFHFVYLFLILMIE